MRKEFGSAAGTRPINTTLGRFDDPAKACVQMDIASSYPVFRKMAHLSVGASNQIFDELADWNSILKDVSIDQLAEINDPANDLKSPDNALIEALGGDHG